MIRLSSPIRRAASVAAGLALLYGCAAQSADLPGARVRGHIATRPGRPGFVVAAPHGSSDVNTDEMAVEIARRTGFGLVVATGFAMEPDSLVLGGGRYQVNRPLEGVPGRPASESVPSDAARRVYEASGAKRDGILRVPERALHIELPKCARRDWRATYTSILADFLIQAIALPAGR